jgi:hypothetical protein
MKQRGALAAAPVDVVVLLAPWRGGLAAPGLRPFRQEPRYHPSQAD